MRLQILHLPGPADEYPFALVIDDVPDARTFMDVELKRARDATGAVGVLVFRETVEVV